MTTEASARHVATRADILAAAAGLIAERGYHGMSMRELARTADVGLSSLYHYFASKEALLYELQSDAFEALAAAARTALEGVDEPVARLYVFVHNHVRYFTEHSDVMQVLVHEAGALPAAERREIRRLKEAYFAIGRDIVRGVVTEGCGVPETGGGPGVDEAELERATYTVFGMINWVYAWYEPERHGSVADVAASIHRVVLCGLVTRCPHRALQDELGARVQALPGEALIRGAASPEVAR